MEDDTGGAAECSSSVKMEEVDLGSYGAYAFGPSGADEACLNNNPEVALTNLELNGGGGSGTVTIKDDIIGGYPPPPEPAAAVSRPTSSRSTLTSSSGSESCTLPFSAASSRPQTACNELVGGEGAGKVGSYGDILNVLERMEQEEDGADQVVLNQLRF